MNNSRFPAITSHQPRKVNIFLMRDTWTEYNQSAAAAEYTRAKALTLLFLTHEAHRSP